MRGEVHQKEGSQASRHCELKGMNRRMGLSELSPQSRLAGLRPCMALDDKAAMSNQHPLPARRQSSSPRTSCLPYDEHDFRGGDSSSC